MELTFAWFWIIQATALIIGIAILYKAFAASFDSKPWNIILIIWAILYAVAPIKIDGANTSSYQMKQTQSIDRNKELPPKTVATGWQKITVDGISKEDLK